MNHRGVYLLLEPKVNVVASIAVLVATIQGVSALEPGPGPAPTRAPSGVSLVIPPEQGAAGTPYHAIPGRERQVSFVSDTPLETVEGHTRSIVGYAIAGPAENLAALRAGAWAMPVRSLKTGLANRDKHIAEPGWLDADRFPDVTFRLLRTRDVKQVKPGVHDAVLVGQFSVRGVTRAVEVPARITLLPSSDATRAVVAGDLMRIAATFRIRLSDYAVKNDVISVRKKFADEITITTDLVLSTVPPEQQPEAGAAGFP